MRVIRKLYEETYTSLYLEWAVRTMSEKINFSCGVPSKKLHSQFLKPTCFATNILYFIVFNQHSTINFKYKLTLLFVECD